MTNKTKIIDDLWDIIKEKENSADSGSYTYDTLQKGIKRASQKLGEEASELIVAALAETKEEVILVEVQNFPTTFITENSDKIKKNYMTYEVDVIDWPPE